MVADVERLQHQRIVRQAVLEPEIPAQGVRTLHFGVQERDRLAGEGQQSQRIAGRLQEAVAGMGCSDVALGVR